MKDKRQRIAVAWPYAAVYSDPAFAASILQAAANSVGMPYSYNPNPILPPVMPNQLPSATHFTSYGYRYSPYPLPTRSQSHVNPYGQPMINTIPQGYGLSMPKSSPSPLGHHSPNSPNSTSLSPGSDKVNENSIKPSSQGLLMPASISPPTTILNQEKPKLFKPYKSES